MNDLMLSETLLADLYQAAVMESSACFQQSALKRLEKVIGFDRAWWGIMSQDHTGFKLLSSLRHALPAEFETHWQCVSNDDALASHVQLQPRTTIHYNQRQLLSTPGLASLNTEYDLRQALCTSMFLPDKQSFLFISLFRSGQYAPAFSAHDITVKQLITPHLYACWRTHLIAEIERAQGQAVASDKATAFVDRGGAIVCANQGFDRLAGEVWPLWSGGRQLPLPLLPTNTPSRHAPYQVRQVHAGGLIRVDICRSSGFNRLSRREQQVACAYAQARSYKQIALDMQLTPATVRYYIQAIYEKLNLHNKAELVKIVETAHTGVTSSTHRQAGDARLKVVDYLAH